MKINRTLLFLFAAIFTISACKKEHDADYSNYLLSTIKFERGAQRTPTQLTFEYDSLNRLIRRTHELTDFNTGSTYTAFSYQKNSITEEYYYSNYRVYKTDDNGRVISDIRYPEMDSTHYEYDGEGYLINKSLYRKIYGFQIWQDSKYTYQNGNMVMAVTAYYDAPGTRFTGADTMTFSYDNTTWYPEAKNLEYVPNVLTGRPNRNNISDIHLNPYLLSYNLLTDYRDIHFTYTEQANRLGKVFMDYTDRWRFRDTIDINFSYKPTN
ncbi:MAG TPA: hypothetical protein VF008_01035 [Niastella sp.]